MFEQTDEKLIQKAVKGNKSAWLKLIKRYEKQMYNYALRMVGNADDALDVMQEVFISVFRNLASYRGEGAFKSWLYRIAHFRVIEFYRRKRPMQSLDDTPEQVSEPHFCPENNLQYSQQGQQLAMAMQSLPLAQKSVVELKFFGEFTFDEIAEQLGISSNTAKSRLYSGLDKLKVVMEMDYV
ncbi:RNA polymerase sigma factor [Alteromonadaceae bacterium BrNp21-10]|nr:RNA polymerase sigma factor [Alteromonadaceae bacterium BrNp21-10]